MEKNLKREAELETMEAESAALRLEDVNTDDDDDEVGEFEAWKAREVGSGFRVSVLRFRV